MLLNLTSFTNLNKFKSSQINLNKIESDKLDFKNHFNYE